MRMSILVMALLLIFLSACDSRTTSSKSNSSSPITAQPNMKITNPSKIELSDKKSTEILYSLDKSKYKRSEEIQYSITNNSGKDVQFGEDFILEKKINNTWMTVQIDNYPFPAIGYILNPKGTKISSIILGSWIEDGTYRLIKTFTLNIDNSDVYISSNEFELQ